MFRHFSFKKHLSMLAVPVLVMMAHGSMQGDPVTLRSTVLTQGANYSYDFAITNGSSTDPYFNLISVDFALPAGSVLGTPVAPAGNGASADPSGNFVEFTSNNVSGFPLGATVDGFQFVSGTRFNSFSFTANYLDTAGATLTTFNGTTSPQASTVPEPSTLGLFAGASLLLFSKFRSLRRS